MSGRKLKVSVGDISGARISQMPKSPLESVARKSLADIRGMVKAREASGLVSAAISQMDKPVRVAAIKGIISMDTTAGLRAVLKNACEPDEAWMAAYALMARGNNKSFLLEYARGSITTIGGAAALKALLLSGGESREVVFLLENLGDSETLVGLAKKSGDTGAAAVEALKNLDAKEELAALVAEIRGALNGQSCGMGIVGSTEQLKRGMDAVAALEEIGAMQELQNHVKGVYSTDEARQLRLAITTSLKRL